MQARLPAVLRLSGGFEECEDLFAFVGTRVDGAEVLLPLHFPDRRNDAFFFDRLIMNVFRVSRSFGGRSLGRFFFYRFGGLDCFF